MLVTAALHVCISTTKSCSGSGNSWSSSLIPAVVGAIVGGAVAFFSSWTLRRSDRAWQRDRDHLAVELEVLKPLDDALVDAQKLIATGRTQNGGPDWGRAHEIWEEGWVRLTPHLDSEALEARYRAVGTILLELSLSDSPPPRGSASTVVMRAIANGRLAIAYSRRGQDLPPASFPSAEQTVELLGQGEPTPFAPNSPLRTWLDAHEQPPWRIEQERKRLRFRLSLGHSEKGTAAVTGSDIDAIEDDVNV